MAIPARILVSRALARGERYAGAVAAESLARLQDLRPEDVSAEFTVVQDRGGQRRLEGSIQSSLEFECRLCERRFRQPLRLDVALVLARDEAEEERLMASAEPLLVEDDQLPLHQIIEDEILLGLPMFPRCPACDNGDPAPASGPEPLVETTRPLAALKNLSLKGATPARRK